MSTDRELLELAARAAEMVNYDPETGSIKWKRKPDGARDSSRWNCRYAGQECGCDDGKGYVRILFRFSPGKTFKIRAHRLAWFIAYGVLPLVEIDHINQNKADNRILNLRDVPKFLNQRNGTRKSNNTSGVPGVIWHKQREKWRAQASLAGKHFHLGLYDDIAEAERATKKFRLANDFTETHGNVRADTAEIGKA